MPTVIAVDHLTKRYGHTVAVEDVSFTVEEGEIFGVIGPIGAESGPSFSNRRCRTAQGTRLILAGIALAALIGTRRFT